MTMKKAATYPEFDTGKLRLLPLEKRENDLDLSCILPLAPCEQVHPDLAIAARRMTAARENGASMVLMMGAHVLRAGVQHYLMDMMEKGFVSCLAMNGAGIIHDYEFALAGATTESVARYIKDGRFGLWKETGKINHIIRQGDQDGMGMGEAMGAHIARNRLPHADISVLAAAWRLKIPVTVHVGIGYDIIHQHPNFDPAACGRTSYRDFLRFAAVLEKAGKRRGGQFRQRGHGAGGVSQGPGHGAKRGGPKKPPHRRLHHPGVRFAAIAPQPGRGAGKKPIPPIISGP